MANITILCQLFPPETNAGAKRIESIATVLSTKHNVTVIAPMPGYPASHHFNEQDTIQKDTAKPYKIIRNKAFRPHDNNLVKRAIREILMAVNLFRKSLDLKTDIVIASSPSMFLIPLAWLLAKLKKAKLIYDLRDLTWLYIRETANYSRLNATASNLIEKFMVALIKKGDIIVSPTDGVTKYLIENYNIDNYKILTIMNGVSNSLINLSKSIHSHDTHKEYNNPIVYYIGLFGNNHGIETILETARQLPKIRFRLVGGGTHQETLLEYISINSIKNVEIMSYVTSEKDIAKHYNESTILLSHIKDTPVMNLTAIPAKLFEYMAFGKPIVYAAQGISVDFVNEIGCAISVQPDNPEQMAQAIKYLLNNPDEMRIMGQKGQEFVNKHYRREETMKVLLSEISTRFDLSNNTKKH